MSLLFGPERLGILASLSHYMKGKGHYGEYLLEYALNDCTVPGRFKNYSNVLVPRQGKATSESEIDVLMLHEKGIYVFESKNYSGWIFGSADQQKWTVRFRNGHKEHFYNPIKQNQAHVRALAVFLGLPEELFLSFIVFGGMCELKSVPEHTGSRYVLQRQALVKEVRGSLEQREVVFGSKEFEEVNAKLASLMAGSTKEALAGHVEEAKAVASGKVCPYCGSELKERKRRSDGGSFIGCSAFPKCRYTRKQW